jgi:hypothetical protein
MGEVLYVDLEVLASVEENDYLIRVSKKDLLKALRVLSED